jgi:hypothetical protein
MAKTLTATDRKALIRLASSMAVGSHERRAILAGLKKAGPRRVWQTSTLNVYNAAKQIAKDMRRAENSAGYKLKVKLGPMRSDYNREIHVWTGEGSWSKAEETVEEGMDVIARKMGLRKGASYGWFGNGMSVIEDNDLDGYDNKQTPLVSISIEDGTEEEFATALAKGFGHSRDLR